MTLLDTIKIDQLSARKNRDSVIGNLLGVIISIFETKSKQGKSSHILSDEEVLAVLKSTSKQISETLVLLENSDRTEEVKKLQKEKEQLDTYMPHQLSVEELTNIARRQNALGDNLGKIMAYLKQHHPGQYDAKAVSQIIKELV